MSNVTFENRLISTNRNIRQRSQLKYSKHGTFIWVQKKRFFNKKKFSKLFF